MIWKMNHARSIRLLPHLKDRIKWEEHGECKFMLQLVIFLYNFRSECVGFNQIASAYLPHLKGTADKLVHGE